MYKKLLSIFITLAIALTMLPSAVFALDESKEIKNAMNAIKNSQGTILLYNDMTADEFLREAKKVLPEGSEVELSFSKETDYRIWNASSEKDGTIIVNILFTCGVYTQHEMFDFKMPKLTGEDAEANANRELLDADAAAVGGRLKTIAVNNDSTKEEILEIARENVKNGSTVEWVTFEKVDSTKTAMGSIKGTLKLTLNSESVTVDVSKLIRLDIPENQNIPRTTPQPKGNEPAESTPAPEKTPEPTAAPEQATPTTAPSFSDVANDAYYANAVKWAVEKNITAGTTATTFSPDDTCTRAQILTFLWRAVGSPKAELENPFADVKESDYFYDAAIWAYEKDMIDSDNFEGNTPCTRASTVMYMWLNADAPDAETTDKFSDVPALSEYAEAVAWAVENGITSGTSDTEFSPDTICSRGQIVTFLNRGLK